MPRTILIVEDEADLADTCRRLLRRRGWDVVLAGSRDAALTAIARQPPALAIIDRQLLDGDGLDVLRAAVAIGTPVIMVSGYGSAATGRIARDEGAAAFLAKPFAAQDLLQLVHRIAGEASDGHITA